MQTARSAPSDQLSPQHLRVGGVGQGSFFRDLSFLKQGKQAGIHGNHILFGGGIDNALDLRDLAVTDHIADGGCHSHDLEGRNHIAVHRGNQLLRYHGGQNQRELHRDLPLLIGRKDVDDTVDGVGRADGMQGGENQVAGLRVFSYKRTSFFFGVMSYDIIAYFSCKKIIKFC